MKRIHRIALSFSSGILLSLAWLGFPGWILFVALLPLLVIDKYFVDHKEANPGISFWGHALIAMFVWNLLTTWWIAHATIIGAIMAIVVNSFLMSLVWWLAHEARRRFSSNLGYIALTAFWISFEYFHLHWDIEWPWLQLGNGFANNVKMVQWYEFTGTFGGTLWVLSINFILFKLLSLFSSRTRFQEVVVTGVNLVLLIFVPLIVSLTIYSKYTEQENPVQITLVQPSIDPYNESYDFQAEQIKMKKFIELATQSSTAQTDLIIGPETIFENPVYWNEANFSSNQFLNELKKFMHEFPKAELFFGVSTFKEYADKESASVTARENGGMIYDQFNTALLIDRNGNEQIYHKTKLVGGVEKMPFMQYMKFMNDIVIDIGGTTGSLGSQTEASVFTTSEGLKIAPVICYESVFGNYVSDYIRKGAELIVVITNDGWWKNSPGYKQHMSFARLRAIETRRSVARAANTGISGFINQRGDVIKSTSWWTETALSGSVNSNDQITFYAKHGDFIARVSLFFGLLLLLLMVVKRFR